MGCCRDLNVGGLLLTCTAPLKTSGRAQWEDAEHAREVGYSVPSFRNQLPRLHGEDPVAGLLGWFSAPAFRPENAGCLWRYSVVLKVRAAFQCDGYYVV